ncbi:glutaminyl-peptide cyclotransferase [uncultured Eudoraea sp.]|uniref:glutaminyl-peptide cyclotransferase n=1 Tax=uncultured Eudoraea sp. TaxID=1035614 RepID=UPI00263472A8|nr:glutaminyl-peptide cyclotransferase [uncultured Eudoraea sp.]
MNFIKFFIPLAIATLFLACEGDPKPKQLFSIELAGKTNEFRNHEPVAVSIKNKKGKTIDNVSYSIDGKKLQIQNDKLSLDVTRLGLKELKAVIEYEGNTAEITKKIKVFSGTAPEIYTYEIVNEYPHDLKAFTQGLEFYNDTLYESTGSGGNAKSFIRKLDFKTGKILQQKDLAKNYFGEGITILNDKLYQLTWQSRMGFVYRLQDFKELNSFQYGESKEGWGLCNDGKMIYKSDGTEKIWLLDPETLTEVSYIETVTNKSIFNKANELEYVDGKIYANVWQKESMMIIDAESGAIVGVINMAGLKNKVKKHTNLDVLNGVAYNPGRGTFFVTGKNWDKLFEIKIMKK